MLTNLPESLFCVQCYSKIPNNIQFKKKLVSAANQHKFCFTMYPIYSLRRAPGVVCCSLYLEFFSHCCKLGFTCLYHSGWSCCRLHMQHSGSCWCSRTVHYCQHPAHGDLPTGCQLLFLMCIDFMPKQQVLFSLNKVTIIILPCISINPLLPKSLKIFYGSLLCCFFFFFSLADGKKFLALYPEKQRQSKTNKQPKNQTPKNHHSCF